MLNSMQGFLHVLILLLGIATYGVAFYQMLYDHYVPSFFSRGVWFLLGINSFAGVLLGKGSEASVILAGTLFFGNAAVFVVSYKKGSRDFGLAEKLSLALLLISGLTWALLREPYVGLVISLVAHFVGGIPTLWRVVKDPNSERAYHWYFFFAASALSILASTKKTATTILFPVYFVLFDGLIILLVNRKHFVSQRPPRPRRRVNPT